MRTSCNVPDGPRGAVRWFADLMESKLVEHEHKSPWWHRSVWRLQLMLKTRVQRLDHAILHGTPAQQIKQATNVANYAMMIADNAARSLEAREDE